MRNSLFIFLVSIVSCGDDRDSRLSEYAHIKCAYVTLQAQRDSGIEKEVKPLELKLASLKQEFSELTESFDSGKMSLENQMVAVEDEYLRQYKKISSAHEAKHGHMITHEYERKIAAIENRKQEIQGRYKQQIEALEREQRSNEAVRQKEAEIKVIETKLMSSTESIRPRFDLDIHELQQRLDNINEKLDDLYNNLSPDEQKHFAQERERIKGHPCK